MVRFSPLEFDLMLARKEFEALADAYSRPDVQRSNKKKSRLLSSIGKSGTARARDLLMEALLTDSSPDVRWAAATGLGRFRDDDVEDALLTGLTDPSRMVRNAAAISLGKHGPGRPTPLRDLLLDDDASVRGYAAEAIGHRRDESAVDALIGALNDSKATVRLSAASALAEIGDHRALEPLNELLRREKRLGRGLIANAIQDLHAKHDQGKSHADEDKNS